jgi:HlyD family secretion protein
MKTNFYSRLTIIFLLTGTLFSCGKSNGVYDASGTFEVTEVVVSAEGVGKILWMDVEEGQVLSENQLVGAIDSTQLHLRKQQLLANQKALLIRRPDLAKQIAALEQQIVTAKIERARIQNLVNANAANQKQLDDIQAQIAVLEKQLTAQKSTIETTNQGISGDNDALQIQIEQLEDQLRKCRIVSPINGTVLVKYAEKGEVTTTGKALFKIGDTNNLILRAYITADQLTQLKKNQKVTVFADFGKDEMTEYEGVVTWISEKSEFTPKTIQTRDERANLVYAVKIKVKNDGFLKIGMYGNVKLN